MANANRILLAAASVPVSPGMVELVERVLRGGGEERGALPPIARLDVRKWRDFCPGLDGVICVCGVVVCLRLFY